MSIQYTFQDTLNPGRHVVGRCSTLCGDDCDECATYGLTPKDAGLHTGILRTAHKEDIPAMRTIYNYEVTHGVATLDENPRSLEDRTEWYHAHKDATHPLIVATVEGIVIGYASLSPYRAKDAYRSTVELSVYVHPDYRGRGVATGLMASILRYARRNEVIQNVVSVITAGNDASVKLHRHFGFTYAGTIAQVAEKFDQKLDIENYYLLVPCAD